MSLSGLRIDLTATTPRSRSFEDGDAQCGANQFAEHQPESPLTSVRDITCFRVSEETACK